MKNIIYFIVSIFVFSIIGFFVFRNLPIEITRSSDIKFGKKLIENIEKYQTKNNELPKNDDWKTLENLGFIIEDLGTKPNYQTDNDGNYELIYLEGFDGPYLIWNSKVKKWVIGNPSIFTNSSNQ